MLDFCYFAHRQIAHVYSPAIYAHRLHFSVMYKEFSSRVAFCFFQFVTTARIWVLGWDSFYGWMVRIYGIDAQYGYVNGMNKSHETHATNKC